MKITLNHLNTRSTLFVFIFFIIQSQLFAVPEITSRISSDNIFLSDALTLEIDVSNAEYTPQLKISESTDILIQQLDSVISSSSTTIINGKMTKNELRTFKLSVTPQKTGRLTIPPIEVTLGKDAYIVSGMTVTVDPPPISDNMLVEVKPTKRVFYVNEIVAFKLKWFLQVSLKDYKFLFPPLLDKENWEYENFGQANSKFNGITIHDQKIPFEKNSEYRNGRYYTVYSMNIEMRATKDGKINIPPIVVSGLHEKGYTQKLDIFGRTVRMPKLEKIFAANDSFSVTVLPLPNTDNLNFAGMVGQFKIEAYTDIKEASVGDRIPFFLKLSGTGYKGTFLDKNMISLPEISDDFNVSFRDRKEVDEVWEYNYYLTPKHTAISEIPSLPLYYFDPRIQDYQISSTASFPLKVKDAKKLSVDDIFISEKHATNKKQLTTAEAEIEETNNNFPEIADELSDNTDFFLLAIITSALPMLGFLVVFGRKFTKKTKSDNLPTIEIEQVASKYHNELLQLKSQVFSDDLAEQLMQMTELFIKDVNQLRQSEYGKNYIYPVTEQTISDQIAEIEKTINYIKYTGNSWNNMLGKLFDLFEELISAFSPSKNNS